ncbi:hypothetical protein ACM75Z_30325 [Pseudomonas aeruginosa]
MNSPKANTVVLESLLTSIAQAYNQAYNELVAHVDDVGQPALEVALRDMRRGLSAVARRRIEDWLEQHEYAAPAEPETGI